METGNQKPWKRLYRSRDERMIAGVCGGLAIYFGIDPILIRLAMVVLAFTGGYGILFYSLLWIIVPREP